MSNINPYYNDRVRYTLKNKNLGSLIITEPIGWDDDEKEFSRNEEYHGIFAKFSNSLKFIDSGQEYIQTILDIYGINEEIQLTKDERHPKTDVWTLSYSGYLDLSTWATENNQISIKFNSGGLEQLLKSREGEKVEIDRITTIDGNPIPELQTIDVELLGRRIFLKSDLKGKETDNYLDLAIFSNDGNDRSRGGAFPMEIINRSHVELAEPSFDALNTPQGAGTQNMMFFLISEKDRTLDIDLDFNFTTDVLLDMNINYGYYAVALTTYSGGSTFNVKNRNALKVVQTVNFNTQLGSSNFFVYGFPPNEYIESNYSPPVNHNVKFKGKIDLLEGESLALEVHTSCNLGGTLKRGDFKVKTLNMNGVIKIEEDSFAEKSTTKAVFIHEIGERLVNICTNKENAFYSEYLGKTDTIDINGNLIKYQSDGKASYSACTHGFWVRGFDKLPLPAETPFKIINNFKPLTTSIKDYMTSLSTVWNVGMGIEKIGYSERVRVEEMSYFYNRNITIRLPNQVKNVKRTIATDKFYSSLEFGYVEGGEYEETFGLDEFNTKSTFTTIINRIKNAYSKLSEYRADSYGMEFTRRKPKSKNDTEDTTRDNSIWILDLKRGMSNLFQQRKWQDDFEKEPTGVYSPETAFNLRFSPINILLRHSWWFSGGLKKYPIDYLRYGSSKANSRLKTKLRIDIPYASNQSNTVGNGVEYSENGNIINSELNSPLFLPEEIEFEHTCNFDVLQQINGFSTILGKKIPNFYGTVEFINENNEKERGFLLNLKPNSKGNFKLIKANR